MVVKSTIGSTSVATPGVYSSFQVVGSFANITPSPRNILIVGEATEGAPASEVELKENYFNDLADVIAEYQSGPIVDAALQLFTTQPDRYFNGQVGRVYVAKTNQSTAAFRVLANSYGSLKSNRYGDIGNFFKSKISDISSESLPSDSFSWLPVAGVSPMDVAVNGVRELNDVNLDVSDIAGTIAALDAPASMNVNGSEINLLDISDEASVSVSLDEVTLSSGDFIALPSVGDSVYIPAGSVFAGGSNENVGAYLVSAVSAGSIVMNKMVSLDASGDPVSYVAPVAVAITAVAAETDVVVISKIDFEVLDSNDGGATLEIAVNGGDVSGAALLFKDSPIVPLSSSAANVASLSALWNGAELEVSLIDATWTSRPVVGSVVHIKDGSKLAGPLNKNVGLWLVSSVATNSIKLINAHDLDGEDVDTVFLGGDTDVFEWHVTSISTDIQGEVINSSSEREIQFEAVNTIENTKLTREIGGQVALEVSYYSGTATEAKLSIDGRRRMKIEFGASDIDQAVPAIQLGKFNTVDQLADFLNATPGFRAKASRDWAQYPTTILDEVQDLGILALHSGHSGESGRIKNDYWAFAEAFEESALKFSEGNLLYKKGLPDVDSNDVYFSGGSLGATSNEDIARALDDSIYLPVRMVVPLFSRDAQRDIEDGLTSPDSSYSIESIISLHSGHASTASSDKNRKERIVLASHYGDYQDTKDLCRSIGNRLVSGLAFQQVRTVNAQGETTWMLPWVAQCMVAAGRAQALLAMPMLRKAFNMNQVRHIGDQSLFSEEQSEEFNWQDLNQVEDAIEAGLLVFGSREGSSGIVQLSPDVSSVSKINSRTAFYDERQNVIFLSHELLSTVRSVLEDFIGNRQSDATVEAVRSAVDSSMTTFVSNGSVRQYRVDSVIDDGNGYTVNLLFVPVEGVEFIKLNVVATREL